MGLLKPLHVLKCLNLLTADIIRPVDSNSKMCMRDCRAHGFILTSTIALLLLTVCMYLLSCLSKTRLTMLVELVMQHRMLWAYVTLT